MIFGNMADLKDQVAKTQVYAGNIDNALRLKREEMDFADKISLLDSFFVKNGEEPFFVEKAEKLGKDLGLKVETNSILEDKLPRNGYKTLSVSISFSGSLSKSVQFLKSLETMPYAVSLEDVKVDQNQGGEDWTGSAKISVYEAKDNSQDNAQSNTLSQSQN